MAVSPRTQDRTVLSKYLMVLDAFDMDAAFLNLSQIAARTGLPVSTVHRLLGILEGQKLVERMPDRTYRLGIRLWELASRTPGALGLREIAMPFMQLVHNTVRQHVQLGVMSDFDVLFLERLSARGAVVNATLIGGRIPLPASSTGQVLLAEMDDGFVQQVVAAGVPPLTNRTPVTGPELTATLEQVRHQGYAVGDGLVHPDARGVGVPIRGHDGAVVAGLGVVVPNDDQLVTPTVELLKRAARGISGALRASYLPPGHPGALPGARYRALVNSSDRSMEYFESLGGLRS